jgi:hypothetical protein
VVLVVGVLEVHQEAAEAALAVVSAVEVLEAVAPLEAGNYNFITFLSVK